MVLVGTTNAWYDTNYTEKIVWDGDHLIKDSLTTKSAADAAITRASAVYTELQKLKLPYTFSEGKTEITIKRIAYDESRAVYGVWLEATRDGKEVYTRSPVWVHNSPIVLETSRSLDAVKNEVTVTLKEDPLAAVKRVYIDYVNEQPLGKAEGDDTIIVYAIHDGYLSEGTNANYTTLRNDVGDSAFTNLTGDYYGVAIAASSTSGEFTYLIRAMYTFNTSSIDSESTISSANISLYIVRKGKDLGSPKFGITGGSPANTRSYVAGDYDSFGDTRYATDIPYASISNEQYNVWDFNAAGLSAISKTGDTVVMCRDSWDIDNTFGGIWKSSSITYLLTRFSPYDGDQYDPKLTVVYTTGGGDPPVAAFSGNVTTGYPPFAVLFTDSSTNTPTAWNWTFESIGYSSSQNPTQWFNVTIGNTITSYDVYLYANNTAGGDWENKTDYITAYPLNSSYTCNTTYGYPPFAVLFTSTTNNGTPTTWDWYFPNGGDSHSSSATWTFDYNIGNSITTYNIALNSSNTYSYDWQNDTGKITAYPLNASFTANATSGCGPMDVLFTDATDNGTPTAWNWSFGDGEYSDLQNPTHTFSSSGTFNIILNASNLYSYDIETKNSYIEVTEPITDVPYAAFTANITSGNPPMLVQFNDTSHLANLTATAWYWNFGDGTTNTSQNITHWYNTSGTFTVVFTTKINGTNYTTSQNILLGGEGIPVEHGDSVVLQTIGFVPDFIFIIIFSIGITMLVNSIINYSMISAGMSFGSFTILSLMTPLLSKFYDFQIYDPTTPSNWLYIPVIINTIPPYLALLCYGLSILSFFLMLVLIFYTSMNWLSTKREPPMGEDFLQ